MCVAIHSRNNGVLLRNRGSGVFKIILRQGIWLNLSKYSEARLALEVHLEQNFNSDVLTVFLFRKRKMHILTQNDDNGF